MLRELVNRWRAAANQVNDPELATAFYAAADDLCEALNLDNMLPISQIPENVCERVTAIAMDRRLRSLQHE